VTMAAVKVAGRRFNRKVDVAQRGSALIGAHTAVLPVYFHESFSHVSFPGSPARGMV
jgi:hypothetical protein